LITIANAKCLSRNIALNIARGKEIIQGSFGMQIGQKIGARQAKRTPPDQAIFSSVEHQGFALRIFLLKGLQ
jgi:hypothetical protein